MPARLPALVLLLLVAGCSSASTYEAMTVAVRDKLTGAPVPGAVVHARSVNFFLPLSYIANVEGPGGPDPILDGSPPRSARGTTGEDGTVRLEVILDHPVQVLVVAAGYEPQTVDLERHPARRGEPSPWLDADPGPATAFEAGRLEVRFIP